MRRNRLALLLAFGLVAGGVVVLRRRAPPSPNPEPPPAAPAVEPRKSALQADAEGYYVPGYEFTVNRLRFSGFSLRPEPLVMFARTSGGAEQPVACLETVIRADSVHLRCDDPQLGMVTTIDGTIGDGSTRHHGPVRGRDGSERERGRPVQGARFVQMAPGALERGRAGVPANASCDTREALTA